MNGIPPHGDFGPSKRTKRLRPVCNLNEKQIDYARSMRKRGASDDVIAKHFDVSLDDVHIALSAMRTRVLSHRRRTLNVTVAAYNYVLSKKVDKECVWQTVDRILTEHEDKFR